MLIDCVICILPATNSLHHFPPIRRTEVLNHQLRPVSKTIIACWASRGLHHSHPQVCVYQVRGERGGVHRVRRGGAAPPGQSTDGPGPGGQDIVVRRSQRGMATQTLWDVNTRRCCARVWLCRVFFTWHLLT